MIINSKFKTYEVEFTHNFSFVDELKKMENVFIIIDSRVMDLYQSVLQPILSKNIFIFKSYERNKNIKKSLEIIDRIIELSSKRNTVLISIGGGIIQDISGFIASILYRGIQWVFIPTTLLSQSDSCIGSKTSMNYNQHKNLLGTFYPPTKIYLDVGFISTLTHSDYLSGLGEIAKLSLMKSKSIFTAFQNDLPEIMNRNKSIVDKWVKASLNFKKLFIESDEFDMGKRKLLNFGHTFGHAIEKSSKFKIPHGQAVTIGICIANNISEKRGMLSKDQNQIIKQSLKLLINKKIKNEYFNESFYSALKKDKKMIGNSFVAILLKSNLNEYCIEENYDLTFSEIDHSISMLLS